MNRKLLLVGAVALAGMLAMSSAVSAAVDDPILDAGDHLVVMLVDDSADIVNVIPQSIEREFVERDFAVLDEPVFAIEAKPLYEPVAFHAVALTAAADVDKEVGCTDAPSVSVRAPLGFLHLESALTCTTDRRHDPGWRAI